MTTNTLELYGYAKLKHDAEGVFKKGELGTIVDFVKDKEGNQGVILEMHRAEDPFIVSLDIDEIEPVAQSDLGVKELLGETVSAEEKLEGLTKWLLEDVDRSDELSTQLLQLEETIQALDAEIKRAKQNKEIIQLALEKVIQ